MNKLENKKLLADLIARAESGEHTKTDWIRCWTDYKTKRANRRALELLIRSLEYSAKSLFKEYCKQVKHGTASVITLLVRNELLRTADFYKHELRIILDMIREYEAYIMDGNLLEAFLFNEYRPQAELWDRRDADNGF